MTHVNGSRRVKRQVTTSRGEPLVLLLTPEGIWLREPRRRTAYLLPYGAAFQRAAQLHADAERAAKAAARKSRKAGRGR